MSREYSLLISTAKSMLEKDGHNGRSRWEEAKEAALAFADICCDFDTDGLVDVFFYGEEEETSRPFQVTSAEELKQQFDVKPTAKKSFVTKCLQRAIDNFPLTDMHTIIVITDGQVNDQEKLIALIKDTAQQLENDENLAISFIQVGKDKAGKRFLKMLDDELVKDGCKFDIVDTKTCTEVKQLGLVETLRQAITD